MLVPYRHFANNGDMSILLRPWLRYQYAQVLHVFKMQDAAIRQLRLVLEDQPGMQKAWRYLGFVLAEQKQDAAAIRAMEQAISIDPDDAVSRFNLGFALQQAKRLDEAAAQFDHAVRLLPTLDRAWYGWGLVLLELRQHEAAAEKLKEAARLQYFNAYASYYLALAYHKLGDAQNAAAEYQRVKSFDPKMASQMERDFGDHLSTRKLA